MSDGIKAAAEDAAEFAAALRKVGLYGDKKWGDPGINGFWYERTIKDCAAKNYTTAQTIEQLHKANHEQLARADFNDEMKERAAFADLKKRYG